MDKSPTTGCDPDSEIWPEWISRSAVRRRLLLIDDHTVVREGLRSLLSFESDLQVVGAAASVAEGIELVSLHHPDLIVSDLTMPGCSGGIAVRTLMEACPTARVLVLSVNDSRESIRAAFSAGAVGYVRKDASREEMLSAIRTAAAGHRSACLGVRDTIVRDWLEHSAPTATAGSRVISDEDGRLLRLIALGVPSWRIAEQLGRGVKVVEKQRAQLMRCLGLKNAAAIVRFAVGLNLLSRLEVDRILAGAPGRRIKADRSGAGDEHSDHR